MYTYVCGVAVILPDGRIIVSTVAMRSDSIAGVKERIMTHAFRQFGAKAQIIVTTPRSTYELMELAEAEDLTFEEDNYYA